MNGQTSLLRQVHPSFFPNGEISSQAFFPFPKDNGKLSSYDGDQITPEASYQHYTAVLELESVGVWSVTGAQVVSIGLQYQLAPVTGNAAHAIIDFKALDHKECRKLAKRLKRFAIQRGCLFRASQATSAGG